MPLRLSHFGAEGKEPKLPTKPSGVTEGLQGDHGADAPIVARKLKAHARAVGKAEHPHPGPRAAMPPLEGMTSF